MWRRIAALPHKQMQSRLCGDFLRINVVNTFMRRRATHKAKIAFMLRNGDFLPHKEVELTIAIHVYVIKLYKIKY